MRKKKFKVNPLLKNGQQTVSVLDGTRAYANLREKITKAGILDRSYDYYTKMTLAIFTGFAVSTYYMVTTKVSITLIFWAFCFTFFTVQIAGLLHDAGHRAIFKSTLFNDIYGNICGFFIALGYNAWKVKHNKHHAHTNQEGGDPDVEMPILSFTKERFGSKKGIPRLLVRYQAWLYFPIGVLVIFSPRLGSMKYLKNNFKLSMWWEVFTFGIPFFAWFFLPFLIFDAQKAWLLFFVVNLSAGFYLFNVFAPNHKGMPLIDKGVKFSFLEQQIITSRNINSHWLVDFVYMGLNHQIEHHLFPNTPRNKLSRIRPYVLDICRKMKIEYTSVSVLDQNIIILKELNQMGKRETS